MYLKVVATIMLSVFVAMPILAQTPTRPFPQALSYPGTSKPNRNQELLNQDVISKYNDYKTKYLKTASGGKYYIYTPASWNNRKTISESHGYGMMIFALMAGYDANAKTIFDGMNAFRKAKPSNIKNGLMSWEIVNVDANGAEETSATDGDLDNAYALLLAYKQWGDNSYLTEANALINVIKSDEMHQTALRPALGDWDIAYSKNNISSRTSDWIPGHFRAFAQANNDPFWTNVANNIYTLYGSISNSTSGLVPDFTKGQNASPDAAGGGTGEDHADKYYYNGCRNPWRLATDYAHHGTPAAKTQIDKISSWLRTKTNGQPSNIKDGYHLNGNDLGNYARPCFVAPFAAGMIANSDNQTFLNSTYSNILTLNGEDVYDDGIRLLCMLLISGNWWAPDVEGNGGGPIINPGVEEELGNFVMSEWSSNCENAQNCDGYGSKVTITENDTDDGRLVFNMTVAAANEEDEIYPWASIGTYFEEGDFPSAATKFEITYTSTAPLMITFEEPPVMVGGEEVEGYARGFELPAQSTEKTVTVYISDFEYPDWGDDYPKPALNKSKIAGIMIEAIPKEGVLHTVNATITSFKLVSSSTPISFGKTTPKQQRVGIAGISVSQRNINLNIPSEKTVTLKISDVRGRLLYSKDVTLNSGIASLNIPSSIAKNQMLILGVSGKNGLNVSQKILLK